MSQANLDPAAFWESCPDEPEQAHPEGGLYHSVPLLSWQSTPVTIENEWGEVQLFLPTLLGAAILFRKYRDGWWFFPLVTSDGFANHDAFDWLLEEVNDGGVCGWCPAPPLDQEPSPLSEPALIYLERPTVVKQGLVEELDAKPVAKLSSQALHGLQESVIRALQK